jgi:hypothetical protein
LQKFWFVVKVNHNEDQLMSMQPRSKDCRVPPTKQMQKTLKNIFSLAIHPYVAPMSDLDLLDDQNSVVFMQPLFVKGSLKDVIHGVRLCHLIYFSLLY